MKRIPIILCASAILMAAGILFGASPLQVKSGTWIAAGSMNSARIGAAAVLLQDGRILVTGGTGASGPANSAEFFAANGTFSLANPMNVPRSGHVAVVLRNGRVLVAGGTTTGGAATNSAEIYDPNASTWTSVTGGMIEARSGATAVVLQDGRVLVAGGQNGSLISSTIEIFDPSLGTFAAAGMMSSQRTQHAMTLLQDGRVLIAGGNNGTAPVASTDIFSPVAGVSAGPTLSVARFGHSATTLLNGQVVVIGGNNGNANPAKMDVTPAEMFDPTAATPAFTTLTNNLATPREGHLAFLLPNNNNVLIVGGTSGGASGGATLASAELFTPQTSAKGVWTYVFGSTGSMATARSGTSGAANQLSSTSLVTQTNGVLLIAGGKGANGNALNSSEAYGFATVQTDRGDYPPGTTVTITGSGWQPGETVKIRIVGSPLVDTYGPYTAIAQANGTISNTSFATDPEDVGVRFTLTAVGSVSQAQTSFTDSNTTFTISGSINDDVTGTGVPGVTVKFYTSTFSTCGLPSAWAPASTTTASDGTYTASGTANVNTLCAALTAPAGYTASGAVAGTGSSVVSTSEISTPDGSSGGASAGNNFSVHKTGVVETIAASNAIASYSAGAQSVPLTATVTSTDGAVNAGSVTFTIKNGGTTIGTAISGAVTSSSASVIYALPAHTAAKSYTIQATYFTGGGTSAITDTSHTLTVSPASLTVTGIIVNTKIYNGNATATLNTASATLVGVGSGDSVTLNSAASTATFVDENVANGKAVTVTGLGLSGTSGTNYTLTQPTGLTGNITPKALTYSGVTVPASKVYDGTTVATVSGISALQAAEAAGAGSTSDGKPYSVDSVTLAGTATGTYNSKDVATATTVTFGGLSLTGTGNGNYTLTVLTHAATITRRALTVTANNDTKIYGQTKTYGAGSTAFTSSGLQSSETIGSVTLAVSGNGGAATATVAGSPYTITPSAAAGGTFTATDYTITYASGKLTVTAAPLTYTANAVSRSYDTANPAFTGTVTGFVGSDTQASVTKGTLTFTSTATTSSNAGSYPINGSGLTANTTNYTFVQAAANAAALTVTPATPTVTVIGGTFIYNGNSYPATATALGVDGITPVTGSFSFAYTPPGNSPLPTNVGTYAVIASFTSSNLNYSNAIGSGLITINVNTTLPLVNSGYTDSSDAPSAQFNNTSMAGDMLFIGGGTNPNTPGYGYAAPPTFSEGNAMSSMTSFTTSDGNLNQAMWTSYNITGGDKPTITCNTPTTVAGPNSNYAGCYYLEFGGVNALDQVATLGRVAYSGSTLTSASITTTHPNEILICLASQQGNGGFTGAGAGWAGLAFGSQGVEYRIAASAGTYSCTVNLNGNTADYAITIASFYKGSAAAPIRVQGVACEGSGTSVPCTLNGVAPGDMLVWGATASYGDSAPTITASDNCGGTYSTVDSGNAIGTSNTSAQGTATGSSGSCTVTFSATGGAAFVTAVVEEITPGTLDQHSLLVGQPVTGGGMLTTASVTTTAADYAFSYAVDAAATGTAPTVTIPFAAQDSNSIFGEADADFTQVSSGAVTASWTIAKTTSDATAGIMTFTSSNSSTTSTSAP